MKRMLIFLHNKNAVLVRVELPSAIPPSYRGMTVRYIYYVRQLVTGWKKLFQIQYAQRNLPNWLVFFGSYVSLAYRYSIQHCSYLFFIILPSYDSLSTCMGPSFLLGILLSILNSCCNLKTSRKSVFHCKYGSLKEQIVC